MSHPIDPLPPEERDLAARLARLGPHDGPSPALDARILAAAHAAVAPKRPRRWLALSAVPASLITGAGMAAALALVVGVVWQLRPSAPPAQAPRDEAGDMGYVSAQILERPAPPAPPAPPPMVASAPAPVSPPPMAKRRAAATVAPERAVAAAAGAPAGEANEHFVDEAVGATHRAPEYAAEPEQRNLAPLAAPVADSPPAPATMSAPADLQRYRAAATAAGAMQREAVASDSQARRKSTQAQAVAAAAKAEATEAADVAAPAAAPTAQLDHLADSDTVAVDLPVHSDSELAPDDWLQRIRARRDSGDIDSARRSLELFRKAHPRLPLPEDLRALATPTR